MQLKTILHIDDDLDDISIFQEAIALINPSYLLDSFSDPKAAVSYLEETPSKPNIIFLDINMPKMNGKETLRLIRSNKELDHVPVVIYSTYIQEAEKSFFIHSGANALVQKAENFERIMEDINSLLTKYIG